MSVQEHHAAPPKTNGAESSLDPEASAPHADRSPNSRRGETRIEVRDGRTFTVTVLPEAKPPPDRRARTPWHRGGVNLARAMRQFDAEKRRADAVRDQRAHTEGAAQPAM